MIEDAKDKNLEGKLEDKNINKVTLDVNEDKKYPWVPPWMSAEYHKLRGFPPFAGVESFIFSSSFPYVAASAWRRMQEWHWDKNTPGGRTFFMGLGLAAGSLVAIIPPAIAGYNWYDHDWKGAFPVEYSIAYFVIPAVTNATSYLYEKLRKKPVIRYRDPSDDKPSNIGK